ncbi:hypothetical protein AcW1_002834 [Taiwanofungus camphoratus]|nr:hypothetical protein AcW1_002834 [Antrodia cinnamomea]
MDPENKPKGASPHYSLYQRDIFKRGGTTGQLPSFSVHPDELQESAKTKLTDRAYLYANSNAGRGWTDRANRDAFFRWRIVPRACVDTNARDLTTTLFGHRIPAPILFAPIGINKLYSPLGELVPAKIAGELGLPYCLSTAGSQPIEDVARANDAGAAHKNDSNSVHAYDGPNGGAAQSPRFFQLYMGHDDEITLSLLTRAWDAGFDVLMLTTDTWQLGWRPTDINIANYTCVRRLSLFLSLFLFAIFVFVLLRFFFALLRLLSFGCAVGLRRGCLSARGCACAPGLPRLVGACALGGRGADAVVLFFVGRCAAGSTTPGRRATRSARRTRCSCASTARRSRATRASGSTAACGTARRTRGRRCGGSRGSGTASRTGARSCSRESRTRRTRGPRATRAARGSS